MSLYLGSNKVLANQNGNTYVVNLADTKGAVFNRSLLNSSDELTVEESDESFAVKDTIDLE